MKTSFLPALIIVCLLHLFSACKPIIAVYDHYAYAQSTAVKVDALNLMDDATSPYESKEKEIEEVMVSVQKVHEYEKHRPQNNITVRLWDIVTSPDRNLFGGFIKRWQTEKTLSKGFINEAKIQVGEAFDIILELESHKIKESDAKVSSLLSKNP